MDEYLNDRRQIRRWLYRIAKAGVSFSTTSGIWLVKSTGGT